LQYKSFLLQSDPKKENFQLVSLDQIFQYEDSATAGKELQQLIKPGDVILVKGSQGVRAERVVEEIMAEPERAGELLVRQDPAWRKR
jgi:hypothetical protein